MDYNVVSDDVPEGMSALEIASAGQRFGAWLIDTIVSIIITAVAFAMIWTESLPLVVLATFGSMGWVLFVLRMIAYQGQTPGKRAIGIKIVRTADQRPGCSGMFLREIVGKLIPAMIPIVNLVWLLSYLWIVFDDLHQGWHDKIAGTYVVKV